MHIHTSIQVSSGFTSLASWLLMLVHCHCRSHDLPYSLSAAMHGAEAPCRPWEVPQVFLSLPALLLLGLYLALVMETSWLGMSINPLARGACAQVHGRTADTYI